MNILVRISMVALLLAATSCARHKIIPDRELAMIFHDAFLSNAYTTQQGVELDSLNIYEPIFEHYGYTTEDVQYTIGNFSKRKSARLSDVVEEAIARLELEGRYYDKEVAILDTVDNVARRTFSRVVLSDSLIRVGALRDTARLSFAVDVVPGEYELTMDYEIDSLDRNKGTLRSRMWLERADSTRTGFTTNTLRRNSKESLNRTFKTDTSHRRLCIHLLTFGKDTPKRPSITVRNLKLRYTPPASPAVDSLYLHQLNTRIFADEFFHDFRPENTKDSLQQTLE